ncbi:MAG TPA: hypothetical protein VLL51_07120 [Gemmatimonadales bacterium]|nr:hypothetical protein [Gemmatimonadales bacterium]
MGVNMDLDPGFVEPGETPRLEPIGAIGSRPRILPALNFTPGRGACFDHFGALLRHQVAGFQRPGSSPENLSANPLMLVLE